MYPRTDTPPDQWYEPPNNPPRCYHCGETCTEDEWCWDCNEPVCEACQETHADMHAYFNSEQPAGAASSVGSK